MTAERDQRILRSASNRFARQHRLGPSGRAAFIVDLERAGMSARSEVEVEGPINPPSEVAELLGVDEESEVVARRRRMFANDVPVQLATSYVSWTLAEGTRIVEDDPGPGGIYARIEEAGHEIEMFKEDVTARLAMPEEVDALRLDAGAPVILVSRVALDKTGTALEVCQHTMNAARYRLSYHIPAN